jgi:aldose 1-epimerase
MFSIRTAPLRCGDLEATMRFKLALVMVFGLCAMIVPSALAKSGITSQEFGTMSDGQHVQLYKLTNKNGMEVEISNFGGVVQSLKVPDKNGKFDDVVLGYDKLEGYVTDKSSFGALIGRYGNRIAHGKFTLDGHSYTLATNNGENHLHGGVVGFNKKVWTAKEAPGAKSQSLTLNYLSKDGEEGYPGNLNVTVIYTLTDNNELKIQYDATTDKNTIVNLTNHSYFNLSGQDAGEILGHELTLHADKFTPVGPTLIPTGELREVKGTPFDFTKSTAIGARIGQSDEQLKFGNGYDHNWVLNGGITRNPRLAAEVYDAKSGRVMDVLTTEPGVQFYTGNFLDGTVHGKGGHVYNFRNGLCLETQHYPDSPNHPDFPTTELKPGQKYHTITIYKFLIK